MGLFRKLNSLEFDYKIHVDFSPEKAFRVHHISQGCSNLLKNLLLPP